MPTTKRAMACLTGSGWKCNARSMPSNGSSIFVPVDRVMVSPPPENISLLAYLSANLYVPVESVVLSDVISSDAAADLSPAPPRCVTSNCAGAALRDEGRGMSRQISLYDPAFALASGLCRRNGAAPWRRGRCVGLLVAWGYFTVELRQLSGQALTVESLFQENRNRCVSCRKSSSAPEGQESRGTPARPAGGARRPPGGSAALDSGQLDASPVFSEIFEALGRQRVDRVWLTKVDLDAGVSR